MTTSTNIPSTKAVVGNEEDVVATHITNAVSTVLSTAKDVITDATTVMDYSSDIPVTWTYFNVTENTYDFDTSNMSHYEQATNSIATMTKKNTSQLNHYTDYTGRIALPIAFILGLMGNGITIVTMMTKPFTSMTWSVVLSSLAVADTVVLLAVPFNKPFVINMIGTDIASINTATCKLYHFTRRISKMVSAWLLVLVCFERFIAVCFPLKVKRICTRRRTIITIIFIIVASAAICTLWISTADVVNGLCIQTVITPESRFKAMFYIMLGSFLIVVLPIAIMAVITPITCFVLRRHMHVRAQLSSASGQTDNYLKASAMLISLCVAYVVLLIPTMVSYNLAFYYKQSLITTRNLTLIVLREISNVLELMNYSSNFFLYTAFNDLFRSRVIRFLTCSTRQGVTTDATSCTQMNNISRSEQSTRTTV